MIVDISKKSGWIISLSLGLYSMTCFFLLKTNWKPFLKGISFANIFYCILTIGMMFLHQTTITPLGILYFSTEIIIIGLLVYLELKVARSWPPNQNENI